MKEKIEEFLMAVTVMVVSAFMLGFLVMLFWNITIPNLFNLPELDYWKSVSLFFLCHLLFK